jgi:membrane protein
MIFKYVPDVEIAWRDVWIGAGLTALLFAVGKFLLGLYLGWGTLGSAYGATGSLVVLLVWIYYSAQILFFGAEVTQAYARLFGGGIQPRKNAVVMAEEARSGEDVPHKVNA